MDRDFYNACAALALALGTAAGCGTSALEAPLQRTETPRLERLERPGPPIVLDEFGVVPVEANVPAARPKERFAVDVPSSTGDMAETFDADDEPHILNAPERATATPIEIPGERRSLPWANAKRTPTLVADIQQADRHVRQGFDLGQRGAIYSAKSEFLMALGILANAQDRQQQTTLYRTALSAGLQALEEIPDFFKLERDTTARTLEDVIAAHHTRILKHAAMENMTGLEAAKQYAAYAHEQLSIVAYGEVPGSMALFGLGRVASLSSGSRRTASFAEYGPAMAYYQAALMARTDNYMAANELALLYSNHGDHARARTILIRSLAVSPQVVTWRNLSQVHARRGEDALAAAAAGQARAMEQAAPPTPSGPVQWVDPETFARAHGPSGQPQAAAAQAAKPKANTPPPTAVQGNKKQNTSSWFPWMR